jgi:hypothetical protein
MTSTFLDSYKVIVWWVDSSCKCTMNSVVNDFMGRLIMEYRGRTSENKLHGDYSLGGSPGRSHHWGAVGTLIRK